LIELDAANKKYRKI